MNKVTVIATAIALAMSASTLSAATVVNGSFEDIGNTTLNGSGWSFFNSIPGWTGAPTGEVQSAPTIRQVDAQDGQYYVELDTNENSTIYQDISFGIGSYTLSFFYSPRVNDASQGTNDMLYSVGNLLSGSVNDAPNLNFPYETWTEVVTDRFNVTTAGTYRLSFSGAGAENESNRCGDCGALIDNVTIAAVPLPAGALLLLTGLAGLGLSRRRKAKWA